MGLFDSVLGRRKAVPPNLDQLFAVPSAALTLQSAAGFAPTGIGSVCFRAAEGGEFARLTGDVQSLLDADGGPPVERSTDSYGFTWLLVRHDPADVAGLVTELHAVNSSLENAGFGPALLCSLITFEDRELRKLALVYLYKRGTFYPFAPLDGQRRDTALELQVKAQLADDLRTEDDLSRWFPVWGAPGI